MKGMKSILNVPRASDVITKTSFNRVIATENPNSIFQIQETLVYLLLTGTPPQQLNKSRRPRPLKIIPQFPHFRFSNSPPSLIPHITKCKWTSLHFPYILSHMDKYVHHCHSSSRSPPSIPPQLIKITVHLTRLPNKLPTEPLTIPVSLKNRFKEGKR